MGDDLLDAVRDLPRVMPYLHVPAQSGCDIMLKRMKRMYTIESYREMLARCREKIPGVAISSDFIVGFCGETEESFQKTCDLVHEARFKNSFIFKYSARAGTKADELYPDDVPEEVKKVRNNELLAIQSEVSLADQRQMVGQTVEVLVEGPSKNALKRGETSGPTQLTGRTPTDHIVVFDGNPRLAGRILPVTIRQAAAFTLFGDIVTGEQIGAESREPHPERQGERTPEPGEKRFALPLV
jgi:tRNA-2-methylthio-N6-dimethylallyladenosine synthase